MSSIKVHIWGGLGSQLYGFIAATRIKTQYPKRKIKICFHSSGLTRRVAELDLINVIDIPCEIIDDWNPTRISNKSKQHRKSVLAVKSTKFVKNFMLVLGLIVMPKKDVDFFRLKPWSISVRGDYSRITLTESEIKLVCSILNIESAENMHRTHENETLVHFRSGDLLAKKQSSYIQPSEIEYVLAKFPHNKLLLFTDGDVVETLEAFQKVGRETICRNSTATDVISESVRANIFIGSSSKLSLWAAIIRAFQGKGHTFIPKELRDAAQANLGVVRLNKIKFY